MAHVYLTESELEFLAEYIPLLWSDASDDQRKIIDALGTKFSETFQESRERHCIVCGAVLTSPNPRKQTCSDACRQNHSRRMRAVRVDAVANAKKG